MSVQDSLWIRRYEAAPDSRFQLVCFPHAGGSAPFYTPLGRALAPDIDVLAVQYPGRQDRRSEPCIDNLQELARQIALALQGWIDRPLALFGHSMGSTVAFELARILEHEQGIVPAWLFVSARRAPSRQRAEWVHKLSDDGLVEELRRLSGTAVNILSDDEVLRMILPALRADYRATETYQCQPGSLLSCPVTAFTGDLDAKVNLDELRAWQEHSSGPFDYQVFSGGHFFLVRHQAELANIIRTKLASVTIPPTAVN